jgi:sugar phosphate isomerase/epimerase
MRYTLLTMVMGSEIRITKPTFIHLIMARAMGFVPKGEEATLSEVQEFFASKGRPLVIGDMSFEDFVVFAKETGYDAVQAMSFHIEIPGEEARRILEKHGMPLDCLLIIADFASAATDAAFARVWDSVRKDMDKAVAAGSRSVLIMPTALKPAPGISREEAFDNLVRGLRTCARYAQEKGIAIVTEPLQSIATPYCSIGDMTRVLEAVPELGFLLDTGNILPSLDNPVIAYRKLKDRIVGLHLKDFAFVEEGRAELCSDGRKIAMVPYGTGIVDFPTLFSDLRKDGFSGYIAFEGAGRTHDGKVNAKEFLAYFRDVEAQAAR